MYSIVSKYTNNNYTVVDVDIRQFFFVMLGAHVFVRVCLYVELAIIHKFLEYMILGKYNDNMCYFWLFADKD